MRAYSGVGAYLSSSGSEVGAYSRGGLIREWGLNRSFTVIKLNNKKRYEPNDTDYKIIKAIKNIKTINPCFPGLFWRRFLTLRFQNLSHMLKRSGLRILFQKIIYLYLSIFFPMSPEPEVPEF